jgi:hypothetical protein
MYLWLGGLGGFAFVDESQIRGIEGNWAGWKGDLGDLGGFAFVDESQIKGI